ncbi:class I SAM-dependent methyltransferase [Crateriforma conspicua]|uniref:class I SAM-dependent methyltransferase n=1 Tax=Crateriforma conspicua TaxID=2527996 RepID=UPI00118A5E4F|nr:class I SAM-dependent methyltransferase [Crateriforma conspicua]QDV65942.1 bifunctional 3-demethylubiquinone-9 3-methyltransferase/ 2-octaprenyl-6-hydroxy phenol methylase [Crateriforma conspicua]
MNEAAAENLRDISTRLGHKESALRDCLYDSLVRAATDTQSGTTASPTVLLDIGCGRGELMRLLADREFECHGVDLEPACVDMAATFGETKLGGFADLGRLGYGPDGVHPNVVVSSHVLEHVDDPLGCLRSAAELRADRYVFSVPNVLRSIRIVRALLGSPRADHPTHVFGWTRPEFETLLQRAGFEVVGWYPDRVTINPLSGRIGTQITRLISPLETRLLPKLFPMLTSSLTVACRLQGAGSAEY